MKTRLKQRVEETDSSSSIDDAIPNTCFHSTHRKDFFIEPKKPLSSLFVQVRRNVRKPMKCEFV